MLEALDPAEVPLLPALEDALLDDALLDDESDEALDEDLPASVEAELLPLSPLPLLALPSLEALLPPLPSPEELETAAFFDP